MTGVCALVFCIMTETVTARMAVDRGVYSGVSVVISDSVPAKDCPKYLDNLERVFSGVSRDLFALTGGQGFFGSVDVTLPRTWDVSLCQEGKRSVEEADGSGIRAEAKANFWIGDGDAFAGPQPRVTRANGGCGERADLPVAMSHQFLDLDLADTGKRVDEKASALLWSWLQHRHGVFEESGFAGDALFPATFLRGNATRRRPNRGCAQIGKRHFCPSQQSDGGAAFYDREAPTKQNVLCFGASAVETVLADEDFKDSWQRKLPVGGGQRSFSSPSAIKAVYPRTASAPPATRFSYSRPKSTSYALLLDLASYSGHPGEWAAVRRALRDAVTAFLPTGARLAVWTMDEGHGLQRTLPSSVVGIFNRLGLYGRIPRSPSGRTSLADIDCLACRLSHEDLTNFIGETNSSATIIFTRASRGGERFSDLIGDDTFVISHGSNDFPDRDFLGRGSAKGRHFSGGGNVGRDDDSSSGAATSRLTGILAEVVGLVEGAPARRQRVHHSEHFGVSGGGVVSGSFSLEGGLRRDVRVTLQTADEGDVEEFELVGPAGDRERLPVYLDHKPLSYVD